MPPPAGSADRDRRRGSAPAPKLPHPAARKRGTSSERNRACFALRPASGSPPGRVALDHARSAASTALAAAGGSPLCASMRSEGRFKSSAGRAAFPRRALRLSFGERGRSSVVERQLPKLYVEGSIPFARSNLAIRSAATAIGRGWPNAGERRSLSAKKMAPIDSGPAVATADRRYYDAVFVE